MHIFLLGSREHDETTKVNRGYDGLRVCVAMGVYAIWNGQNIWIMISMHCVLWTEGLQIVDICECHLNVLHSFQSFSPTRHLEIS